MRGAEGWCWASCWRKEAQTEAGERFVELLSSSVLSWLALAAQEL